MIDRQSINASLITSMIAIVLVVIVLAGSAMSFVSALLSPGVNDDDPAEPITRLVQSHQERSEVYRDRFAGRSIFYTPRPWPSPPRPTPPPPPPPPPDDPPGGDDPVEIDDTPPPPPPPPADYEGPPVLFVLGREVYFRTDDEDSPMIRVALREQNEAHGVAVLAIDSPRTVTLGHRGGEYEIALFSWGMPGIQSDALASEDTEQIPGLVTLSEDGEEVRRSGRPRSDDPRPTDTGRPTGRDRAQPADRGRGQPAERGRPQRPAGRGSERGSGRDRSTPERGRPR